MKEAPQCGASFCPHESWNDAPLTADEKKQADLSQPVSKMARPERFELPTAWFVARYSIQLSYGRVSLEAEFCTNEFHPSIT
jgi:hypothetical protein